MNSSNKIKTLFQDR